MKNDIFRQFDWKRTLRTLNGNQPHFSEHMNVCERSRPFSMPYFVFYPGMVSSLNLLSAIAFFTTSLILFPFFFLILGVGNKGDVSRALGWFARSETLPGWFAKDINACIWRQCTIIDSMPAWRHDQTAAQNTTLSNKRMSRNVRNSWGCGNPPVGTFLYPVMSGHYSQPSSQRRPYVEGAHRISSVGCVNITLQMATVGHSVYDTYHTPWLGASQKRHWATTLQAR